MVFFLTRVSHTLFMRLFLVALANAVYLVDFYYYMDVGIDVALLCYELVFKILLRIHNVSHTSVIPAELCIV